MDDREIVSAIRARLADRIGKDRYEVWFGATTQLSVSGENLVVSVPSQFFQDWLRSHFRKELEASSLEALGKAMTLEFRIAQQLAATSFAQSTSTPRPAPTPELPSAPVTSPATPAALPPNGATTGEQQTAPTGEAPVVDGTKAEQPTPPTECDAAIVLAATPPAVPVRAASVHAAARKPGGRPHGTLESFVVGDSNLLAHTAAQMAVSQPGVYSPLLVHGGTGTGKTHLLEGICGGFRRAHPGAAVVYLSAEQFTSQFLEALRGSGMPSFRRKYRGLALLAIDDVQFFKDKRATLVELLHTVDELLRSGRQLVLAADRPPAGLKSLGPELISRLGGAMVCRIDAAEYATRRGIVRQQAVRLKLTLADDVVAFIAAHFTTQSRELAGALKRLHAASLAHERPITLDLAQEALADLVGQHHRPVKLSDIEKAVCDVCGLESATLQSGRKGADVSHPRMLAMWLARKHTRAALSEISSYFGRRSHSTVISAQRKVETWMAAGSTLRVAEGSLTLDETIRRVEAQLRAG